MRYDGVCGTRMRVYVYICIYVYIIYNTYIYINARVRSRGRVVRALNIHACASIA